MQTWTFWIPPPECNRIDQRSLPYGVTTVASFHATPAVIRRSRTQVLPAGVKTPVSGVISSGMNRQNVLAEHASMTRALTLRLNEGMPLTEVIQAATVLPAKAINREDLGALREGAPADIAMFEIRRGDFPLVDHNRRRLTAKAKIDCVLTIRRGDVVWDAHGLSIREWTQAGRYTSFR
ncbi:MAG: amidohydrolase family protein [Bryobacterales bacterium]|nr:amidohydrolase family protein [Bryobacterales bacterium]